MRKERDALVQSNHRGLDLQYQLTDSEAEREALWKICIEMKAKELHLSDWNNGKCLIDPAECSIKRSPCYEFCLHCDLAGCEATEHYGNLAEKEIENEIAKRTQ